MSIAEFYGWTYHSQSGKKQEAAECVACGTEINQQRESGMYECERCMNEHVE